MQKVITHDTGMMHIAAAFKRKLFLFGSTVPFWNVPYLTDESQNIN